MARIGTKILDSGDIFPELKIKTSSGEIQVGKWLIGSWSILLFYRGHWCPFCVNQLKSFQNGYEKLKAEGIQVLAASVDSLNNSEKTREETGAQFTIGYELPAKETAETIGAFFDAAPLHTAPYIHSTGFVIDPNGKVIVSVYSSGAIGRLVWQDALGMIQYLKSLSAKS